VTHAAPPATVEAAALHSTWRRRYDNEIHPLALELLGLGAPSLPAAAARSSLLAPVLDTLAGRRNMFRMAFALAAGEAAGDPDAGAAVGATAEVGWTCTLLADDIIDRAAEREGHPPAHVVHGTLRTAAAVPLALATLGLTVGARGRLRPRSRWHMVVGGGAVVARAVASQLPLRRPRDLESYAAHAREVNGLFRWTVTTPLRGRLPREAVRAAETFADELAVNGKFRNDLLDYRGGSSEGDTLFTDFDMREPTFPVFVLAGRELEPPERERVLGHFRLGPEAGPLRLEELLELFERHRVFAECTAIMRVHAARAEREVATIATIAGTTPLVELMRSWNDNVLAVAEERVAGPSRR
jgi:geranylgeranyl pyrophosphate synthase